MDTRAADREVIEKVLTDYAAVPYAYGNVETQAVFDRQSDHYLLMIFGDEGKQRRVHACLVQIDIKGDQVVIQRDGTHHGMAPDLARGGIAPERIVLAFHWMGPRAYSEFLAA
jgi:hypothetical protein